MRRKASFRRRFTNVLASSAFFWCIVGLLIAQAAWIALSGRYPMAFDEDFHLGIIRLYAHHLSPFWSGQPDNANMFGAVARDPSYLYHWLLSFPYNLIRLFTYDQTIQVIWLRFINIGLFSTGLILLRRLLSLTGASRSLVNASLLVFVFLPIVPLLAAQINYDNLLLPVMTALLLMSIGFVEELQKYGRVNTRKLLLILIGCLLASLIKYAFLPIFIAIMAVIIVASLRKLKTRSKLFMSVYFGWSLISRTAKVGLILLLLVSSGLFIERYGVNVMRYHKPVPDCSAVLSVEECSQYGPWIRDYVFKQHKPAVRHTAPQAFNYEWFYGMWFRTFFAVDGPATQFETRGPLLLPAVSGLVFGVAGFLAVIFCAKQLWRRYASPATVIYGIVSVIYIGVLWLDEYEAYVRTGQPVAINGRYLLPVLPFILLLVAAALNELLKRQQKLKIALLLVAVLSLLWGGGAMTYILRGRDAWYWPSSPTARANASIKQTLGPLTPGYGNPLLFFRYRL
jgi:hypothetical protein